MFNVYEGPRRASWGHDDGIAQNNCANNALTRGPDFVYRTSRRWSAGSKIIVPTSTLVTASCCMIHLVRHSPLTLTRSQNCVAYTPVPHAGYSGDAVGSAEFVAFGARHGVLHSPDVPKRPILSVSSKYGVHHRRWLRQHNVLFRLYGPLPQENT